jgi:ankyrin repeat protein
MHQIATSFSEFVESLVEIPICLTEELGKSGASEDLIEYLARGQSLDAIGTNGLTILCEAIKYRNIPMIEACIERNASLSNTIRTAVGNGHIDLIQLLVDAGADVNETDEYGDTPLQYVPGTALPGEEGARNRAMWDLLVRLGAHE